MRKFGLFMLVVIPFFCLSYISPSGGDGIIGDWMTVKKNLKVRVFKENGQFRARILWFNDKGYKAPMNECTDDENPDPALRSRKIIGMQVLSGLTYSAEEERWINGKIYDSNSGHTYQSVVWLESADHLVVKGYYGFEWIGESLEFDRVKN